MTRVVALSHVESKSEVSVARRGSSVVDSRTYLQLANRANTEVWRRSLRHSGDSLSALQMKWLAKNHPPDAVSLNRRGFQTHPPELSWFFEQGLQQAGIHPALWTQSLDSSAQSCLHSLAAEQFVDAIGA